MKSPPNEERQDVCGGFDAVTFRVEKCQFLRQQEIAPWSAMPLWLPEGDPAWQAFMAANVSKAVAQGLVFRPLEATVRDVLAWARARATTHEWKAGLPPAREKALLQAWDDAK